MKDILNILEQRLSNVANGYRPRELYEPVSYTLSLGGKRIRPMLVMMGCELFGGDTAKAVGPAIAVELFHNFTLLHDDIMDKAPLRRGKETVYRKWNENTAILSGDTLFALAYDHLADTNPDVLHGLLKLFTSTAREVCEGQQYDMNFEKQRNVSGDDYLEMIRLKTAVLLACSLRMGAMIANADEKDSLKIYSFGQNLGMAFQLQDDLLDTFGDPATFGKEIGGDILSKKKTWLYVTALEQAGVVRRNEIEKLYDSDDLPPQEKISKVKAAFGTLKIKEDTNEKIRQYIDAALKDLNEINVPEEKKVKLKELVSGLLERER